MKRQFKYYLIIVLTCLSLIGVGFASWIVAVDFTETITGSIVVEDVLNGNDYLECTEFKSFKYFSTAFVNEDNYLSKVGTIKATLKINNKNCKTRFGKDNDTDLGIQLTLTRLNLYKFNNIEGVKLDVSVKQDTVELSCENTKPDTETYDSYYTTFSIPSFQSLDDEIIINVTYTFEIVDIVYYSEEVFSELYRNQTEQFKLSARITGY